MSCLLEILNINRFDVHTEHAYGNNLWLETNKRLSFFPFLSFFKKVILRKLKKKNKRKTFTISSNLIQSNLNES